MTFRSFAGLLALGLFASLGACSGDSSDDSSGSQNRVRSAEPIVLPAVFSLTGQLGTFGVPQELATRVAVNHINAHGGVLGRPLQVKAVDDATNADVTTQQVNTFLAERSSYVPLILGPTGSPNAISAAELTFSAKVLLISPSASTPTLSDAQPKSDRYFFRTTGSHALQAKALSLLARQGVSPAVGGPAVACAKTAVIYADDAYGKPIADVFAQDFTARGGTVALRVPVPTTPKSNYNDEVGQVIGAAADCQVLVMFPDVGSQYIKDFRARTAEDVSRDWSTFVSLGSNGLKSDAFIKGGRADPADTTGPTAGEGVVLTFFDLNPNSTAYNEFKNMYRAHYPAEAGASAEPAPYTASQFDAVVLTALAIQKAGTATDVVAIRQALFDVSRGGAAYSPSKIAEALVAIGQGVDIDYDGASGPVDFDESGDVLNDFRVYAIRNAAFAELEPIKASSL